MLPGGIFLNHKECAAFFELWAYTEITVADIAFGGGEQEDIWSHGVVLNVGDDLSQFFYIRRLQVNNVKGEQIILNAPQIDPQIVCW